MVRYPKLSTVGYCGGISAAENREETTLVVMKNMGGFPT
jgi:hypothetical protein